MTEQNGNLFDSRGGMGDEYCEVCQTMLLPDEETLCEYCLADGNPCKEHSNDEE